MNDRDGLTDMTMLHYACKAGANGVGDAEEACRMVNLLVGKGADVYIRCRWTHMTALHYATYFDISPVIKVLLKTTKAMGKQVSVIFTSLLCLTIFWIFNIPSLISTSLPLHLLLIFIRWRDSSVGK